MQKPFRHWPNRIFSCNGCSKRSTHTRRSASGADINQSDDQSGLSSTAPDHVSATQRPPMSPLRPWVSVGTTHGQNTSGWHSATSGVERAIRQLIIGISDRIGASPPFHPRGPPFHQFWSAVPPVLVRRSTRSGPPIHPCWQKGTPRYSPPHTSYERP